MKLPTRPKTQQDAMNRAPHKRLLRLLLALTDVSIRNSVPSPKRTKYDAVLLLQWTNKTQPKQRLGNKNVYDYLQPATQVYT